MESFRGFIMRVLSVLTRNGTVEEAA